MNERRGTLLVMMLLLGFVSLLMVKPFIGYAMGAAILAFLVHPLHRRLKRFTGEKLSALFLVFFSVVVAVVPLTLSALAVVDDAQDLGEDLNRSDLVNTTRIEQRFYELSGFHVDVERTVDSAVREFTSKTFGSVSEIVGLIANVSVGISVMMFLLYYFIKDGKEFVKWLKDFLPFPEDITEDLFSKVDRTTWDVIAAHVLIAVIQGLVAGLGLAATGVPNYIFWTFVMVILGFIPIIGTIMVWLPASVYLFLVERPLAGIMLALYGFIVVGLTDNILRPIIIDRGSNINPSVIIIGVIGGVYLFGAAGLFIGPIILGMFKSVLLVYKNHYKDL
ncbi:MAG: AI-2E family transporter [Candidatus Nanohaloarchaea archaeon]